MECNHNSRDGAQLPCGSLYALPQPVPLRDELDVGEDRLCISFACIPFHLPDDHYSVKEGDIQVDVNAVKNVERGSNIAALCYCVRRNTQECT